MTILHIDNTVRDYDSWKAVFDSYDTQRRDRGVTSYRVTRSTEDPQRVLVDLHFDDTTRAEQFREFLHGVFRTPQSRALLADHRALTILETAEERVLV